MYSQCKQTVATHQIVCLNEIKIDLNLEMLKGSFKLICTMQKHCKAIADECQALKALCHAISADCLLIEAARAHAVNEHWAWRMADKFACTFKSAR